MVEGNHLATSVGLLLKQNSAYSLIREEVAVLTVIGVFVKYTSRGNANVNIQYKKTANLFAKVHFFSNFMLSHRKPQSVIAQVKAAAIKQLSPDTSSVIFILETHTIRCKKLSEERN
jgi:hypothetical protein